MTHRFRHAVAGLAALLTPLAVAVAQGANGTTPAPVAADTSVEIAAAARLVAAPGADLPMDPAIRAGQLPNGLRYFIRRNARPADRVELRLVVNAGSVLEAEDQRGLAHFVEHMAFNGTRRFEKNTLVDFLERAGMRFGAHVNAYTSFDETVYMLRVPTDRPATLDTAFMVLEDWAAGIAFDSAEVERERGVVIEEWRLGQGADERIRQQEMPVLFSGSRYATRLPIGDPRTLETFAHARLKAFYQDWYRPELMALVVVGDVDPAEIERRVRAGFASLARRPAAPERQMHSVPIGDTTVVRVTTDPELTTSGVNVYHLQPLRAGATTAAYRQGLVEALYNDMLNRRLAEITQRPDAPFVGAYSAQGRYVRMSEFYALGAMAREGRVEEALRTVLAEARRVDLHGFTATELERVKADLLRAYEQAYVERAQQESEALAAEYVSHFLYDEPVPGIALEYRLVQALLPGITLEEVNRLAREWITDRGRVVLASVPRKDGLPVPQETTLRAAIRAVDTLQLAAYDDAVSSEPLIATLPAPGRVVRTEADSLLGTVTWWLGNGVRVIVKPTDFKADEVLLSAFSPGGTSLVPDADALTSDLSPFAVTAGGIGDFDAIALQKKLAGMTVDLVPYVAEMHEGMVGSAAPRELETLLQLFHLYATAPRRDTAAYQALQQGFRASFENRNLSPTTAFNDTLTVTLTQHHPRRLPLTADRIDAVSLDRALALYRDRFADFGDFTIIIVGAVDPDSLRPLVEQYIGSLPETDRVDTPRDVGVRAPPGRVERIVRAGVEPKSSTAMVFTSDFEFTPQNRLALGAVDAVLTMRLRDRLREALGATYGVSVGAAASKIPRQEASLSIRFGSAPERAEELVQAVLAEIDSLRAGGPTADELAKVKETMLRERETNLRENRYWLERLENALQLGEDPRGILGAEAAVQGLTAEQVREAARRWIDPNRFVRVSLLPALR